MTAEAMIEVMQQGAKVVAEKHGDAEPFFVVNPRFHDGLRGAYIDMPPVLYHGLMKKIGGIEKRVDPSSIGRMIALTDKAMVLTIVQRKSVVARIDHAVISPGSLRSGLIGGTFGSSLFDQANGVGGWGVTQAEHEMAMAWLHGDLVKRFVRVPVKWRELVDHGSPQDGTVRSPGGQA